MCDDDNVIVRQCSNVDRGRWHLNEKNGNMRVGRPTRRQLFTSSAYRTAEHAVTLFFTARRYGSALYAVVACPPVRPSVRPSQAGIV